MTWMRAKKSEEQKVRDNFAGRGFPEEIVRHMQFWHDDEQDLQAFLGREWCGGRKTDPLRWHISVRGMSGVPSWQQMAQAAHAIRPGVHFVMMVPPKSLWMNVHPHVLHLWETSDDALVEEAKANALGSPVT